MNDRGASARDTALPRQTGVRTERTSLFGEKETVSFQRLTKMEFLHGGGPGPVWVVREGNWAKRKKRK